MFESPDKPATMLPSCISLGWLKVIPSTRWTASDRSTQCLMAGQRECERHDCTDVSDCMTTVSKIMLNKTIRPQNIDVKLDWPNEVPKEDKLRWRALDNSNLLKGNRIERNVLDCLRKPVLSAKTENNQGVQLNYLEFAQYWAVNFGTK